jgi:hypothetical protein
VIVYVGHGPLAMLDAEGRICGATGADGVNAFAMVRGCLILPELARGGGARRRRVTEG